MIKELLGRASLRRHTNAALNLLGYEAAKVPDKPDDALELAQQTQKIDGLVTILVAFKGIDDMNELPNMLKSRTSRPTRGTYRRAAWLINEFDSNERLIFSGKPDMSNIIPQEYMEVKPPLRKQPTAAFVLE